MRGGALPVLVAPLAAVLGARALQAGLRRVQRSSVRTSGATAAGTECLPPRGARLHGAVGAPDGRLERAGQREESATRGRCNGSTKPYPARTLTDRPSMSSLSRLLRSLASIVSNSWSPGPLSARRRQPALTHCHTAPDTAACQGAHAGARTPESRQAPRLSVLPGLFHPAAPPHAHRTQRPAADLSAAETPGSTCAGGCGCERARPAPGPLARASRDSA